ncbi:predicted protein [Sclerotinia sclerotiorum 1980 UF-70]|uniref:Uncharacterized protein n=1 Tax=Sclerotinia sclerotiorum (strain ATCC 18683 / 1980 / Ss-1) TaxID=665079 RepID=A7EKX9_SCLS1|nr:predicted protein [Sclerotinia sclerotiorum 1980 UF-70]EDO03495.1 predicted protein [Sclerotinia sclerotiorum 1980 UF-70]
MSHGTSYVQLMISGTRSQKYSIDYWSFEVREGR